MGKVEQVAHSTTDKLSEVGSTVVNQASGIIQDIQKSEEGVQEGAIQQPMYVESPAAGPVESPVVAPESS
jgi:hypothetical protein